MRTAIVASDRVGGIVSLGSGRLGVSMWAFLLVAAILADAVSAWAAGPASFVGQDDAALSLPGAEAMAAFEPLVGRWTIVLDSDSDDVGTVTMQSVAWNDDRTAISVEWSTVTESGEQLAGGRGRIIYDDIAGAVVNTYAGRDGDQPFSGSATLISIDGAISDWRGHETRGNGRSVNFEVTYDLRDAHRFLVDFIPTCIDGLDALQPDRFAWVRVDEFLELVPHADDLAGEWVLREGGQPGMPNGCRMSVERGAGGMSLVFLMREPGTNGRLLGVETLWFDPESGLKDLFFDTVGNIMNGEVTMVIEEQPILNVRWRGQPVGQPPMRITSRVRVADGELRVDFLDAALDGQRILDPPSMVWVRP
jgi:hypothetical protein